MGLRSVTVLSRAMLEVSPATPTTTTNNNNNNNNNGNNNNYSA